MSGIDINALAKEVSSDSPCGEDLEYDPQFVALHEQVRGIAEKRIGNEIIPGQPPNWPVIRQSALDLLDRTRDLRVFNILAQATSHCEDFSEFGKCLGLLAATLENQWDSLFPQLDPDDNNDPTQRLNILMGLCDFETVIQPISKIPLVDSPPFGKVNLRHIHIAGGRFNVADADHETSLDDAAISAAFSGTNGDDLKSRLESIVQCKDHLDRIEAAVENHTDGNNSLDLSRLRDEILEIHKVLSQYVKEFDNDGESGKDPNAEDGDSRDSKPGKSSPGNRPIQSRQDVIRVLDEICAYYKRNEPSSPVPILLNRAKRLVAKDFMDIMKDMVPDSVSQVEMFVGPSNEDK